MLAFILTVILYAVGGAFALYVFVLCIVGLFQLVTILPVLLIFAWVLFFFGLPFYLAFNASWFWIFSAVVFWRIGAIPTKWLDKFDV